MSFPVTYAEMWTRLILISLGRNFEIMSVTRKLMFFESVKKDFLNYDLIRKTSFVKLFNEISIASVIAKHEVFELKLYTTYVSLQPD